MATCPSPSSGLRETPDATSPRGGGKGGVDSLSRCGDSSLREGARDLPPSLREGDREAVEGVPMSLPYKSDLIPRAKELRKNATPQEKHLWYDFLSTYPVRFQRQKTIESFIVDFYCHAAKLVIEIDGSQHYEPQGQAYDAERTAILEGYGLEVVRFSNRDINTDFRAVCEHIDNTVKRRLSNDKGDF